MAFYVKTSSDGFIVSVQQSSSAVGGNISENEFDEIVAKIEAKPQSPSGYTYKLRADNLEWELVELPEPQGEEPTTEDKAEAYDILIGGVPDA